MIIETERKREGLLGRLARVRLRRRAERVAAVFEQYFDADLRDGCRDYGFILNAVEEIIKTYNLSNEATQALIFAVLAGGENYLIYKGSGFRDLEAGYSQFVEGKRDLGLLANLQITRDLIGIWGTTGEHVYAVVINEDVIGLERLYKIKE